MSMFMCVIARCASCSHISGVCSRTAMSHATSRRFKFSARTNRSRPRSPAVPFPPPLVDAPSNSAACVRSSSFFIPPPAVWHATTPPVINTGVDPALDDRAVDRARGVRVHLVLRAVAYHEALRVRGVPQDGLRGALKVRDVARLIDHRVQKNRRRAFVHEDDPRSQRVHLERRHRALAVLVLAHVHALGEVKVAHPPARRSVHEKLGRERDRRHLRRRRPRAAPARRGQREVHALRRVVLVLDEMTRHPSLAPHRGDGVVQRALVDRPDVLSLVHALRGVRHLFLGRPDAVEPRAVVHPRGYVRAAERDERRLRVDGDRRHGRAVQIRDGDLHQRREHLPAHVPPDARDGREVALELELVPRTFREDAVRDVQELHDRAGGDRDARYLRAVREVREPAVRERLEDVEFAFAPGRAVVRGEDDDHAAVEPDDHQALAEPPVRDDRAVPLHERVLDRGARDRGVRVLIVPEPAQVQRLSRQVDAEKIRARRDAEALPPRLRRELHLERVPFQHQPRGRLAAVRGGYRHAHVLATHRESSVVAPRAARDLFVVHLEHAARLARARVEEEEVALDRPRGEHVPGGIPAQVRDVLLVVRVLDLDALAVAHVIHDDGVAHARLRARDERGEFLRSRVPRDGHHGRTVDVLLPGEVDLVPELALAVEDVHPELDPGDGHVLA
eukprot:29380-Pelagococcus_subviridis.AAC.14